MDKEKLETTARYTDANLKSVLSKRVPARALIVDLEEKTSYSYDVPQAYLEKYAGGPALGARLWADFSGYSVDDPSCLETENPIVIVPSVVGTSKMPYGNLTSIVFRSPVTEKLMFNNFKSTLSAGKYDAVVIIGRLDRKSVLRFTGEEFEFEDAQKLSGKDVSEIKSVYSDSIICGRAGDNEVLYANCIYEGCSTGRGGLGYVFAMKNIKAVSLVKVQQQDSADYSKLDAKLNSNKPNNLSLKNIDGFMIRKANDNGWAPVGNFSRRYDPRLFYLSLNKTGIPYDARLMLGCNCSIFDMSKVQKRYDFCMENGLDPISVGNLLGCNRITDQVQAMAFISLIIENKGFGKKADYTINGLECGCYDYRGCYAQALSDALGNNFPVYFALMEDCLPKNCAKLVSFNEQLVLGLQSLGVNHEILIPLLYASSDFRCLGILPYAHLLARSISEACRSEVSFQTILKIGENCRTLVRKINSILKKSDAKLPDFFCIEPKSNHPSDKVVPFRAMLLKYNRQNREKNY